MLDGERATWWQYTGVRCAQSRHCSTQPNLLTLYVLVEKLIVTLCARLLFYACTCTRFSLPAPQIYAFSALFSSMNDKWCIWGKVFFGTFDKRWIGIFVMWHHRQRQQHIDIEIGVFFCYLFPFFSLVQIYKTSTPAYLSTLSGAFLLITWFIIY